MRFVTHPASGRSTRSGDFLQPFRRFWPIVVLCVVLVVLVVAGGWVIAGSPGWAHTELPVDQALSRGHAPALDAVALIIRTVLSPVPGLVIVALVSACVLLKTRDWMVSVTFALMVGGGWLSSELVKLLVHRARPDYHLLAHPLSTEANFASFPSGHTCLITALVLGFVLLLRGHRAQKWVIVGGVAAVLIVAWSRLYIGEHYPSDVIAAVLYTSAVMVLFLAVWNRWAVQPLEAAMRGQRVPARSRRPRLDG